MKSLVLENLTIEQKIGQMLLARHLLCREDFDDVLDMIRNRSLGGIHLRSTLRELPVPWMIEQIHKAADYPILICENMEQGFTNAKATPFPDQMGLGASDSEELAYEAGRITAIEAKRRGFNVVFGPIVDLAMNPKACCVGPRCFAADKETVARMSVAMIRGYQDNGMVVTAKHYPGFGESAVDSHLGMVYLNGDRVLLLERELYPYIQAMEKADLSGVMVGHIMVPKIDPKYPASLSRALIELLRETGYEGLVMTDSLAMVGLTNLFGLENCHGLAMAAGNDMVMTSYRISAKTAYNFMLNAYRKRQVSDAQVDQAVRHVIEAQNRTCTPPSRDHITPEDEAIAISISMSAPAAILNGVDSAAIPTDKRHLILVQVSNEFKDAQTESSYYERGHMDTRDLLGKVEETFSASRIMPIHDFPSCREMENIASTSMQFDSVVMIAYSWTSSYVGSSDLSQRVISLLEGLLHKLSAIVLIGNPYAAREFPQVPRLIWTVDGGYARDAALKVLAGEIEPCGKFPIPLRLQN